MFDYLVYSARRLSGSRIIESAAYCNQILLVTLYQNSTQKTSVNWIIRLLLSLLCWPHFITLSGFYCIALELMKMSFFHDVGEILNTLERVSSSNIARTHKVVWQRVRAHMRRDVKKCCFSLSPTLLMDERILCYFSQFCSMKCDNVLWNE